MGWSASDGAQRVADGAIVLRGLIFAEFYDRAGFTVKERDGVFWYSQSPSIFRSLPTYRRLTLALDEAENLVENLGAIGIEYTLNSGYGFASGHHLLRDENYGLNSLQRQFRQNVRRGRAHYIVREMSWNDLYSLGFQANLESMARQRRHVPLFIRKDFWRRYCSAGDAISGSGVFGCFSSNSLVAWLSFLVEDDTCHGLTMMSTNPSRNPGSNHLLYFQFAKSMIRRCDINGISLGLCSNPPAPTRDTFKRHLGFAVEPCDVAIALGTFGRTLVLTKGGGALLGLMSKAFPRRWEPGRMKAVINTARATYGRVKSN